MYIDSIHIKNFRNICDRTFKFDKGLNVIIGTNNSGKTNLIKAINLIDDASKTSINDFNKNELKKWQELFINDAPKIEILYTILHPINLSNYNDTKIIKLLPFMEYTDEWEEAPDEYVIKAKIKMVYSLDSKSLDDYKKDVNSIKKQIQDDDTYTEKQAFNDFIQVLNRHESKFNWSFFNGMTSPNTPSTNYIPIEEQSIKSIKKILDIEYIEADRNLEKMSSISRKLVKRIIDKEEHNINFNDINQVIIKEIKDKLKTALDEIARLIVNGQDDIGINNGNIEIIQDFELESNSLVCEKHRFNILDTKSEFNLPLSLNGLGYNNLISIFLIIKLPDVALDILCIEEPEAHLHPAMQYKLFKYLQGLQESESLDKQIFITTHSSNITAVTGIDNMIMMSYSRENENHKVLTSQLKDLFPIDNDKKQDNKKHLTKFLDVTRSDMLFADKIIFVEGITEKLLLPELMKNEGFDNVDKHISIVEIGGKHFEHFLSVFNCYEIHKKILCITDNDFHFMDEENNRFELLTAYEQHYPAHVVDNRSCVRFSYQKNYGVTFEDSLFLDNYPTANDDDNIKESKEMNLIKLLKLVAPDAIQDYIDSNKLNFADWTQNSSSIDGRCKKKIASLIKIIENTIQNDETNKEIYEKIFFARLFADYIQGNKGAVALDILVNESIMESLITPTYIKEGIEWLKQ